MLRPPATTANRPLPRSGSRPAILALAAACLLILAPAASAQSTGSPELAALSDSAWRVASDGGMAQLWQAIDQLDAKASTAQLAALKKQVDTHRAHEQRRSAEADKVLAERLDAMAKAIADEDLTEGLNYAVRAGELTADRKGLLAGESVRDLIQRAEAAASVAEASGRWLDALVLYLRLDELIDDMSTYKEPLNRISRKLTLLRLYAPEAYYALADDYAERNEEEKPTRWAGDEDQGWQAELRGITRAMLMQAMTRAADKYVEGSSYDRLFIGGIDSLRLMVRMKPLSETFPMLADARRVDRFDDYLGRLRDSLTRRTRTMTYTQCSTLIREVMDRTRQDLNLPEEVFVHEFGWGAMNEMDRFSKIVWPTEKENFERTTKQQFSGVGIQITLADGKLTVVSPLDGTPAHRAGIKAGDRIFEIDGKSTIGITLDQAVRAITGPEGTSVVLGVRPPGSERTRDVKLTRKRIRIQSVKGFERTDSGAWNFVADDDANIGYIRLTQFGPDTADEMDKAVESMRRTGRVGGMILDLRFNGGGRLDAAVNVANRFLDRGRIVSAGEWAANADTKDTYGRFPVIVLINGQSASASEIVAGALQDNHRALIVGENTYGKGSVQEVFWLGAYEAYLKVTTRYYKLPSGKIIHRRPRDTAWGVKPEVQVKMPGYQVAQMRRAWMVLDVLRESGEDVDPQDVVGQLESDEAELVDERPLPTTARQLLDLGYDPQLETGLLLLRAKLINAGEPAVSAGG